MLFSVSEIKISPETASKINFLTKINILLDNAAQIYYNTVKDSFMLSYLICQLNNTIFKKPAVWSVPRCRFFMAFFRLESGEKSKNNIAIH